jgi:hypothetical protein
MTAQSEISSFQKKLESAIKGAFEEAIRNDGYFEIAADYDTHRKIDDLVKGLGLRVYGMSVTPDEFTITFKFSGLFETMKSIKKPYFSNIRLNNNGEYFFNISEDDLKKNWFCGVTDQFFFNTKTLSEEEILEFIEEMNQVLMLTILSN